MILKHERQTGAVDRSVEDHVEIAECQRPLYLDLQLDAAAFEFPAIVGAARETVADAGVILQIMRRDRFGEPLKMLG